MTLMALEDPTVPLARTKVRCMSPNAANPCKYICYIGPPAPTSPISHE
eukprot:COSAG05_NODE_1285_length_5279_cov_2.254633_1_plen_48_part_00